MSSRIVISDKATPAGVPHSLVFAEMVRLQVIMDIVINQALTAFEIVAKGLIFLANFFLLEVSPKN